MLLAVHIFDGVLAPPWQVAGWAVTAALLLLATWRMADDEIPRVGVLTAALFVASLIHIRLGPTSVHLLLNGVAGVILGRRAPVAVTVAVTLQFLMLAHGGLYTVGVNAAVASGPAVLAGGLFRLLYGRCRVPAFAAGTVVGGLTVGLTVALSATLVWLGGPDAGEWLAATQVGLHVPVLAVEAVGSGLVAGYLAKVKPEWLTGGFTPPPVSPPRTAPPTGPAPG